AGTFEAGVYRSVDDGATWTAANQGLTDLNVQAIATSTTHSGTVLAAAASGVVYRSADAGATWAVGLNRPTWVLRFDPGTPGVGLAGSARQVMRSADDGLTWQPLGAALADEVQSIAIDPQHSNGYLAATLAAPYQFDPEASAWRIVAADLPP